MKKTFLYFAYGSNMNLEQMAIRTPEAVHLGVAVLVDHIVVERMYADVDQRKGSYVYGVLYRIGPRELAALDRYEGYPSAYKRVWRDVRFHGATVRAMVYVMTAATKRAREWEPYAERYRRGCSDGARQHGIPDAFGR